MSLTKEDLQAISELMDQKLEPIKADIAELKEDITEIRDSTNALLDWADQVGSRQDLKLPKIV